jgi:hypothetical protein
VLVELELYMLLIGLINLNLELKRLLKSDKVRASSRSLAFVLIVCQRVQIEPRVEIMGLCLIGESSTRNIVLIFFTKVEDSCNALLL